MRGGGRGDQGDGKREVEMKVRALRVNRETMGWRYRGEARRGERTRAKLDINPQETLNWNLNGVEMRRRGEAPELPR